MAKACFIFHANEHVVNSIDSGNKSSGFKSWLYSSDSQLYIIPIKPKFPLMLVVAPLECAFACKLGSRARWAMLRLQHVLRNTLGENIYYQLYWKVPKTTFRFSHLLRDSQDSINSCTHGYNLLQQKHTKHNQQREKVYGMKSRRKQAQISRCPL